MSQSPPRKLARYAQAVLDLQPITHIPLITERDVGISAFITSGVPIHGLIKQRFEDFHVGEVDKAGRVAILDRFDLPDEDKSQSVEEEKEIVQGKAVLAELVGDERADEFEVFTENPDGFFEFDALEDKVKRKALHQAIREHYGQFVSETQSDGKIRVAHKKQRAEAGIAQDSRNAEWAKGKPQYLQFVLHKANLDTIQAISAITKVTGCKSLGYAGTKDRKGITSQFVTAWHMSADRLRKAASKLEKEKIFIGNFEKVEEPKQLGDLYGNQFRIILREIKVNDERSVEDLVNERLSQIRDYGFINYFGMQRFGTGAIPTHELGKSLLQDNVFEVCRLLLAPRENDSERASRARELLKETKDFKTAYKMFPKECTAEKSLLFGLDQFGESAIESAFAKIPRNVRLLYVHAYQSRLWNLAATHRVEKHGYKSPVIGDLVLSRSESQSLSDSSSSKSYEEIVKLVTSENLHLYSIEDVVIPIPGYDAILPENSVKEVIMSCLKDDSLELSSFNHRMRDLRSRGGYRYLIEKPRNLQWELLRYDDSQISLLLSDWEQLNPNCSEPKSLPKGAHLALKLQFELASSSYATILFRELSRSISLDE